MRYLAPFILSHFLHRYFVLQNMHITMVKNGFHILKNNKEVK